MPRFALTRGLLALVAVIGLLACSRPGPLPSQPLGDPQLRADRFIQAMAAEAPDLVLDYSAASVRNLESFIVRTYDSGEQSKPSEGRQGDMGCYLGETVIKTRVQVGALAIMVA